MQKCAIFLIGFLVAIPQYLACSDCVCGSQCFQAKNPLLTQAYEDVRKVIKRIRVGNFLASPEPDSTIFHFDGTPTSFDGFLYQKKLAAIAAVQIPVEPNCNPALVITYFHWGSLAWLPNFSTGCMDKCDTATYIDEFIPYLPTPPIPTNPLSTSCLLAPFVVDSYKTCSINTGLGSHHVAFMNDDIQTPPYPCFSSNARTAVKMAPLTSPSPRFESSSLNSIEAYVTPARLQAAEHILKCIESECCINRSDRGSIAESQGTILIQKRNTLTAQKVAVNEHFRGQTVPMKRVIKSVAMKEELSFISKEHPEMMKSTLGLWNQNYMRHLEDHVPIEHEFKSI